MTIMTILLAVFLIIFLFIMGKMIVDGIREKNWIKSVLCSVIVTALIVVVYMSAVFSFTSM